MHPYAQVQKEDQELPDAYEIKVYFRNGHSESFEIASHVYQEKPSRLEFVTHENKWNVILWDVISRVEFDKRFSKMMEIASKKNKVPPPPPPPYESVNVEIS